MSPGNVVKIFADTRQLLEKKKLKQKYQHLNFYCNWVFHTELSGSSICYSMLETMMDAFLVAIGREAPPNAAFDPTAYFIEQANRFLAIDNLRKEFISFYEDHKIPLLLLNSRQNWNGFVNTLLHELADKPIKFPDNIEQQANSSRPRNKEAARVYRRMKAKSKGDEKKIVRELLITSDSESFKGFYCWEIRTIPQIALKGKLLAFEYETAFEFP